MKKYLLLALFMVPLLAPPFAHAAKLSFVPRSAVLGSPSVIELSLDTEGAPVNAIEGTLTFPDSFTVNSVSDGGSAVSLWISAPKINGQSITFSGVIPGGLTSADAPVMKIVGELHASSVSADLKDAHAYLNDGAGTEAALSADLTVQAGKGIAAATDHAPPESFTPQIGRAPGIFDDRYFVSFATTDKDSGLDHYEVLEVPVASWGASVSGWRRADSPYLLKDQGLASNVYVRAVDLAGNFRIVEVPARVSRNAQYLYVILLIGLICLIVAWRFLRRTRRT